jgi:hypothetical protein
MLFDYFLFYYNSKISLTVMGSKLISLLEKKIWWDFGPGQLTSFHFILRSWDYYKTTVLKDHPPF